MNNSRKILRGIGIIEIVAATAVAAIFFTAIYELLIFSLRTIQKGVREVEAVYLGEEGVEAARFLRNESWTSNISSLVNGTTYYPVIAGSKWTFSTIDPGAINGMYTREVVLEEVRRDVNDDINVAGDVDPDTRKLTVTIEWTDIRGDANNVILETYLANFLNN